MMVIRGLTEEDLPLVATHARAPDVQEIHAAAGLSVLDALRYSLRNSVDPLIMEVDGKPLAALGEAPYGLLSGVGVPWLISTNFLPNHSRDFLRACRPLVQEMMGRHEVLTNFVDVRNTAAIRWLEWLGFVMASPVPYGVKGLPFMQFRMVRGRD